jgi:hypothetical protein
MPDVYLVYVESDQGLGRRVRAGLEAAGLECLEPAAPLPGETYEQVVVRQLEAVQHVLLVVSHRSIGSDWWTWLVTMARRQGKPVDVITEEPTAAAELPAAFSDVEVGAMADLAAIGGRIAARLGRQPPAQSPLAKSGSTDPWQRHLPPVLPRPAPALSDWPSPLDGPAGHPSSGAVPPVGQAARDAVYRKRIAADDPPTAAQAPAESAEQAARDETYARRMAAEDVPPTLASSPAAPSAVNERLDVAAMLAMGRGGGQPSVATRGQPAPQGGSPVARQAPLAPAPAPHGGVAAGAPAPATRGGGYAAVAFGLVAAILASVFLAGTMGQGIMGKLLATLGVKLNAFTLFGLFGRNAAEPAPQPVSDVVDCSLFAPPAAPPGATVLVQVFLHTAVQAERAQFLATVMDAATALKGAQTLQAEIPRGARVTVTFAAKGLEVDEPQQTILWRGEPVFAQFLVTLPEGADGTSFHPVVRISVDGGLVGRIAFALRVDATARHAHSAPAGDDARRYNRAFLSYASPDRKEVLKRAQVLRAAGVEFFQDILSLDPGDRWEREIYKHIDGCDLFLLFWSKSASQSQWVIREAEYALTRQRHGNEPDIVPVILDGPPPVLPPPALADLHFNDQITYLIASS